MLASNPSSQQTEEAVRQFMMEVSVGGVVRSYPCEIHVLMKLQVYENWIKCIMNPFYQVNQVVTSPIFRSRVAAAAKKYL